MEWTLKEADGRLKEVIDLALKDGPQQIRTEDGSVVLVTKHTSSPTAPPKKDFLEFLMSGPSLEGLDLTRDKSLPRTVDFGGDEE